MKGSLPPAYVVRREGNSFTLLVCSHLGGVPISHNALQHFPECHGADTWGGVPCQVQLGGYPGGYHAGGYPGRVPPWQGPPQEGTPLARSGRGVTLLGGTQVGYSPSQVSTGGVPCQGGYPVRTTEGVLNTAGGIPLAFTQEGFLVMLRV